MTFTFRRAAVAAAIGICCTSATLLVRAAPVPGPSGGARFLPVENSEVYEQLGAQFWRLSIPADQLKGMAKVAVRVRTDRSSDVKINSMAVPDRYQAEVGGEPWVVDVMVVRDNVFWDQVKKMKVALSSPNGEKFKDRSATYFTPPAKRMTEPGYWVRPRSELGRSLLGNDGVVLFGVTDLSDKADYTYYIMLD